MVLQSGAKDQFYSSIYYKTLSPICLAQRGSKNLEEKCGRLEDAKIGDLSVIFYFKEKIMSLSHFKPQSHKKNLVYN